MYAIVHAMAIRSLTGHCSLNEARQAFISRLESLLRADQCLLDPACIGANLNALGHPSSSLSRPDGNVTVAWTITADANSCKNRDRQSRHLYALASEPPF